MTKLSSKSDMVIEELIIESDREEHIARHKIIIEEVSEIISGNYVYIKGKLQRWLLIGKTKKGRYLTVIVGIRKKKNTYGLVTARPSRKEEISFYQEFIFGDEEYDEINTS